MTTPDPSPLVLPGSPAGYTQLNDSQIGVPDGSPGAPSTAYDSFESYATSVLAEIQKLLRRIRSQVLFTDEDAFSPQGNFDNAPDVIQKVRIIGENWAYMVITLQAQSHITVPPDGNLQNQAVGTLADARLNPRSLARLTAVNTGRAVSAHVLATGVVYLDAINSGADIHQGDIISMAGMWPLYQPFDSEA